MEKAGGICPPPFFCQRLSGACMITAVEDGCYGMVCSAKGVSSFVKPYNSSTTGVRSSLSCMQGRFKELGIYSRDAAVFLSVIYRHYRGFLFRLV